MALKNMSSQIVKIFKYFLYFLELSQTLIRHYLAMSVRQSLLFGTADSHIFVDQDGIDYSSVVMEIQRAEKTIHQ